MKKLLVFMIDALCSSDIDYMKTLPNFSRIIEHGSYVHHMLPVYPALTYCCHTSILTGCYVDRHGIYNNEKHTECEAGDVWFGMKEDVKVPTLLDYAREHGLTTCSIAWPVSAKADYTFNWPMIVPYHYEGDHPEDYLKDGNATQNVMDKYFWKLGRFQKGANADLDTLTMTLAPDILEDFGQPDVMLVKMCDLDGIRHMFGVYHPRTKVQLKKHDDELGVLLTALEKYGDLENTNIVIMGDHGQTNITDILNMNELLKNNGFMETDGKGNVKDCIAYAHSCALSCYIQLKNPENKDDYKKVHSFLRTLIDDNDVQLAYVLDKKQAKEQYHLEGPFDFVIESNRNIAFSDRIDTGCLWSSMEPGDHKIGAATHGSRPDRDENTLFIASGPSVKEGVVVEVGNMVDQASTMARMIGFEMKDTDGKVIEEILR